MTNNVIGLFGGTFDPVHVGHLRMALELQQHLRLDAMRLVPCHIPPHRETPVASAAHRAAMVELAVAECPELSLERLELHNPEPSYSLHTLQQLREQLGESVSLCLCMGMDSLASMHRWHRWQELLQLAHVVAAARPGWSLPETGPMADYIARHLGTVEDLHNQSRGIIVVETLRLLPISSSDIRQQLANSQSPRFLLPDAVLHYIDQHQLYTAPLSTACSTARPTQR